MIPLDYAPITERRAQRRNMIRDGLQAAAILITWILILSLVR